MVFRFIIFIVISIIGLGAFVTAVVFLTRGHNAEWVTIILAPISGICLAILAKMGEVPVPFQPGKHLPSLKASLNRLKIFNR
jgi:hypothetical protein